MSEVKLPEIN